MDEAASAVAALLDLATVGVEDPVAEIDVGARWPLDQQHLVAANAEMTIGKANDLSSVEFDALADAVEHHKIVAQSLHLGEFETHVELSRATFERVHAIRGGQRTLLCEQKNLEAHQRQRPWRAHESSGARF
jgi:hypothetical protein